MEDKTYVGRLFERCVEFAFKEIEPDNPYKGKINDAQFKQISEDAKKLYKQLEEKLGKIESLMWTGNYTSSTSADLIINGKLAELKYISGKFDSTWINTTINAIHDEYGFSRLYNWYMKEYDVYSALEDEIGKNNVNRKNMSPMGQKEASRFMKEHADFYKEYQEIEIDARRAFVYDVVEYLNSHEDKLNELCEGIVTKSICGEKKMPDILIKFNNITKETQIITKEEMMEKLEDRKIKYEKNQCQFCIGKYRLGFTWKNGVGLFNPVLKVYI